MLSRSDKEGIVAGLKEKLDRAQAVYLTNLIGISANDAVKIRKEVREAGGAVVVTRNTLYARASKGTDCEQMLAGLKGTNALAFAYDDVAAVAKALHNAGKELKPVELVAGMLEGKALDASQLKELATLPGKDQMLATLLATFNAPISAFVRVLHAVNEERGGGEVEAPTESVDDKSEETAKE
jgi:large subunit ribosomal protein L10